MAWNPEAEALFGVPAAEAIGRCCGELVQGRDECRAFCSPNCAILQAVRQHRPIRNFDIQVRTGQGMRWCNVSVLLVSDGEPDSIFSLHIFRDIDSSKRLALSVRDFLVAETALSPEAARMLLVSQRASRQVVLTPRETEILRLLAGGGTTADIADRLCLSRATVNNHTQHILEKFNAHSRLEAVRQAELSGLV